MRLWRRFCKSDCASAVDTTRALREFLPVALNGMPTMALDHSAFHFACMIVNEQGHGTPPLRSQKKLQLLARSGPEPIVTPPAKKLPSANLGRLLILPQASLAGGFTPEGIGGNFYILFYYFHEGAWP